MLHSNDRFNNRIWTNKPVYKSKTNRVDTNIYLLYLNITGDLIPYNFKKKELKVLYNKGMTLRQIADKYGCYPDTVLRYLIRYNIKRRKPTNNSGLLLHSKNVVFVEKLPPLWLIGFIDGEGSFHFRAEKTHRRFYPRLSISQKDLNILNTIKQCFPESKWHVTKSPSNSAYNLVLKGFTQCFQLLWFFDKYSPIEKADQFAIWKFLMTKLLENNYNWEQKEKLIQLYNEEKVFKDFVKKFGELNV